jgi:hypothetical protein
MKNMNYIESFKSNIKNDYTNIKNKNLYKNLITNFNSFALGGTDEWAYPSIMIPGDKSPDMNIFKFGDGTGWRLKIMTNPTPISGRISTDTGTYIYDNGNVNVGQNLTVDGNVNIGGGILSNSPILSTVTNGYINGDSVLGLQPITSSITQLYWECQYIATLPYTTPIYCAKTWIHTEYIINQNASFHKLISSNNADVSNISTTWISGMYYPLISGNNGDKWNVRIINKSIF